jgi:hypothetical protein
MRSGIANSYACKRYHRGYTSSWTVLFYDDRAQRTVNQYVTNLAREFPLGRRRRLHSR